MLNIKISPLAHLYCDANFQVSLKSRVRAPTTQFLIPPSQYLLLHLQASIMKPLLTVRHRNSNQECELTPEVPRVKIQSGGCNHGIWNSCRLTDFNACLSDKAQIVISWTLLIKSSQLLTQAAFMFRKVENGLGLTIMPPSGCSVSLLYRRRPRHHHQLFKLLLSGFQKSRNLCATWSESATLALLPHRS